MRRSEDEKFQKDPMIQKKDFQKADMFHRFWRSDLRPLALISAHQQSTPTTSFKPGPEVPYRLMDHIDLNKLYTICLDVLHNIQTSTYWCCPTDLLYHVVFNLPLKDYLSQHQLCLAEAKKPQVPSPFIEEKETIFFDPETLTLHQLILHYFYTLFWTSV